MLLGSVMSDYKKVSVLIPAYNSAQYIASAIESVLAQDYKNIEIIVINDGSTDATAQILAPYLDRVTVINKKQGGIGSARNLGHQHATGNYIAWLDADDIAYKHRISTQVAVLEALPSLVLTCSDFSAFNQHGERFPFYSSNYYSQLKDTDCKHAFFNQLDDLTINNKTFRIYSDNILSELVFGNFIHPPTVMFRSELLPLVGTLNEDISSSVDWLYLTRLAKLGRFGYIDSELIDYRISDTQLSSVSSHPLKPLNVLRVYAEIVQQNEAAITSNPKRHSLFLAELQLSAANSMVEVDKYMSFKFLLKSLRGWWVKFQQLKVLLKIILPRWLLLAKRKLLD